MSVLAPPGVAAETAAAAPDAPLAAGERIAGLDVVRGIAVLGILVMNVVEFGQPLRAYDDPAWAGPPSSADTWTWLVQSSLFDGKMRALFSMLFGAGCVLFCERLERTGRADRAVDLWLRRCLWLVLFGIVHRFALQWTGDILYVYGLLGLVAVAFRHVRPGRLLLLGALWLGAAVPIEAWRHHQAATQREQAAAAVAAEKTGTSPTPAQKEARARWERRIAPKSADASKAEIEAMRGGYTTVFAYRWDYHHVFQSAYLYYHFVWDALGMMFVGMALQRWGFFAGALRAGVYRAVLAAGIAVAAGGFLWANALAGTGFSAAELELRTARAMVHPFERGAVGLAWASAALLVLRAGMLRAVTSSLARVGRMAFSNYVLQTVCCTLFFFGYGLGRYATLSRAELMLVWLAVTVVQIAASWLWLAKFRFGPLEWLWRSLTYARLQPQLRARE